MPMDETFRVENISVFNYSAATPLNGTITLRHNSSKTELKISLTIEDCGRILEIFRDRATTVLSQAAQACIEDMKKEEQPAIPPPVVTRVSQNKPGLDDEIPF